MHEKVERLIRYLFEIRGNGTLNPQRFSLFCSSMLTGGSFHSYCALPVSKGEKERRDNTYSGQSNGVAKTVHAWCCLQDRKRKQGDFLSKYNNWKISQEGKMGSDVQCFAACFCQTGYFVSPLK